MNARTLITLFFILYFHGVQLSIAATVRIMPLGDSITQGYSSGEPDERFQVSYRKTLWDQLKSAGYNVDFVGSLKSGELVANFDADHEGQPGWTDYQIVNGRPGEPDAGQLDMWLSDHQPHIVLLHIGTNGLDPGPNGSDDVEAILDEIDVYSLNTWVVLARIIARENDICSGNPPTTGTDTTTFNNNVEAMARTRINDKIVFVDMECGAGIDYRRQPLGDMYDLLHPYTRGTGYDKMADVWFSALQAILPVAEAGLDQDADEGDTVTLDGSGSTDPKNGILSYQWEQTTGSAVSLSDKQTVNPTFIAPDVGASGERLTFQLTVADKDGLESIDTTTVDVHNPTSSSGGGNNGGGGCFIATAAYRPSLESHVKMLHRLLDNFLFSNYPDKAFADF